MIASGIILVVQGDESLGSLAIQRRVVDERRNSFGVVGSMVVSVEMLMILGIQGAFLSLTSRSRGCQGQS